MKEGHEGEAPIMDNTRGIVVPTISGQQFILYPSYKKAKLIEHDKISDYKSRKYSEIEALYLDSCKEETDLLLECGSPAAQHVRQYGLDLPNLQMAAAIIRHRQQINEAAAKIAGADQISNGSNAWTCCRYHANLAWYARGYSGYFFSYFMYFSLLAVPVALLNY